MISYRRRIVTLAALFLCAIPVIAQATYGGLSGTVRDQTGAVVAGASILIANEGTNKEYKTQSSGEGVFVVPQLPPGSWRFPPGS